MKVDMEWDDAAFLLANLPDHHRSRRVRKLLVWAMRYYDGDSAIPWCVRMSQDIKARVDYWKGKVRR